MTSGDIAQFPNITGKRLGEREDKGRGGEKREGEGRREEKRDKESGTPKMQIEETE
jgi:hypothetical protein